MSKTEKIDKNTITNIDNWAFEKGREIPEDYNYGGVQNAGKVLKVDTDGFIRLLNGGGGGTTYTGENGISVDNTTNKIGLDKTGSTTPEIANLKIKGDLVFDTGASIDFNGATVDFSGAEVTGTGLVEKTYSELKTLRDTNKLVAGTYYRITDYVATTTQSNTQSANHPFDLIVVAISTNELSENAIATKHSGDTYFGTSTLTSWEILYCLDNDTNRFAWADSVNGKGVIYYLQDEYFNSCWYDFKGIQVKNSNGASDRFYYLFDNAGVDASLSIDYSSFIRVYGNKFGIYVSGEKITIGCNVFKGIETYNNTIGSNFYNNTIGDFFQNNTIGNEFQNNTIGSNSRYNTIGSNFYNNTIGDSFGSNTIGNDFNNNTTGSSFNYNTIGNYFYSNTIGNNFNNNTIGNGFQYNTIGNSFQYNTIGNDFYNNNTTTQTSQPLYCSFPSGVNGKITTSTTLPRLEKTTYYIGSDNTLKTLD